MSHTKLLQRITTDRQICGGRPCIRGTRIEASIVLDALAEGLTSEQIVDHYPHLTTDDIRAAAARRLFDDAEGPLRRTAGRA